MAGRSRSRAEEFLDEHAELRKARERSSVWARIKASSALRVQEHELYLVGGDILGGEDELYLDRLARGAHASGGDDLSRKLFEELPEELKGTVRRDVLLEAESPDSVKQQ